MNYHLSQYVPIKHYSKLTKETLEKRVKDVQS